MQNNDFTIKIPDEYYNMNLVDIQYAANTVIYCFLDDNKNPVYYKYPFKDNYYYYKCKSKDYKMIEHKNNVSLIKCPYNEVERINRQAYKWDLNNGLITEYGDKLVFGENSDKDDDKLPDENFNISYVGDKLYLSDVPVEVRHSLDFYKYANMDKQKSDPTTCYYDIEVYTGEANEFPLPDEAKYPINAITCAYNYKNEVVTYLYIDDPKKYDSIIDKYTLKYKDMDDYIEINKNLFIFNTEQLMLQKFIYDMNTSKSMIITGWNSNNFDFPYIYTRMKNLNMDPKKLSRFNYVDMMPYYQKYGDPFSLGYVVSDMLILYKELTQNKKEKYSLSYISKLELHDDKVSYDGDLNKLYDEDIMTFIKYNRQDVHLLKKLDKKVGHILLQDELRKNTGSTWKYGTPSRLVDALIIKTLDDNNMVANNTISRVSRRKAPGAYVAKPVKPGLGKWVGDLDATSLYPSIARTLNIGPNTYIAKISKDVALKYLYNPSELNDDDIIDINMDPNNINNEMNKSISKMKISELKILLQTHILAINGCIFKQHSLEKSIYYDLFNHLYISRKTAKKQMLEFLENKDMLNFDRYNNIQMTYKVLMNSIYGVLGSKFFRFMIQDLVEAITMTGKEVIKATDLYVDKLMCEKLGKNIEISLEKLMYDQFDLPDVDTKYAIYTDTDSTMIEFDELVKKHEKEIGKSMTNDEIIKFVIEQIKYFQDNINEKLMFSIINKRHIEKEHNYFTFKNEWVARRTWFLTSKKKYGLHKLFVEGKSVDQIETKGLDTERSDYPNRTKEILFEILNILLKESWTYESIMKKVDEYRIELSEIVKNGNSSIAKPVSWAKAEYKKIIPSHIHAMQNWNNLEYNVFAHGSKGYLFYIKGIDSEKYLKAHPENSKQLNDFLSSNIKVSAVIALPQDYEKLPDYYIIDVEKMMKFVWEDRWIILLEPINIENRKGKLNKKVLTNTKNLITW